MNRRTSQHLQQVLSHLYINPLEKCNLRCKICYTNKTSPILSSAQILEFISRYQAQQKLQSVTFCGGEVFALPWFAQLINDVTFQNIFVQVITNGTLDQLDQITTPNTVNLIVSLDGLPAYHDSNRGEGNFNKSLAFMRKASALGFHLSVFSIITQQNLEQIDDFEAYLQKSLGFLPDVTYHPRKPPTYLMHHPVSNIVGEVDKFDFLTATQMRQVMKSRKTFPPTDLGCYQISLTSDGRVFGCCEGTTPIGRMSDSIPSLIQNLQNRLVTWERSNTGDSTCLGCSQSDFMCGIKEYLDN